MSIKLNPKNSKFCAGCPKKELKLNKAPDFIIDNVEYKDEGKVITILSKSKKDKMSVSLF